MAEHKSNTALQISRQNKMKALFDPESVGTYGVF